MSVMNPTREVPPVAAPAALNRGGPAGAGGQMPAWPLYIVLAIGLVLLVGPFLWMLIGSFKPAKDFLVYPPPILPSEFTTANYDNLFTQLNFPQFFANSLIVAAAVTIGNLAFCSMLGYAL